MNYIQNRTRTAENRKTRGQVAALTKRIRELAAGVGMRPAALGRAAGVSKLRTYEMWLGGNVRVSDLMRFQKALRAAGAPV